MNFGHIKVLGSIYLRSKFSLLCSLTAHTVMIKVLIVYTYLEAELDLTVREFSPAVCFQLLSLVVSLFVNNLLSEKSQA